MQDSFSQRWWENAVASYRTRLDRLVEGRALRPEHYEARLDELVTLEVDVLEIFAPAEGGASYEGLDTLDHFRIDPRLGSMDDFVQLVCEAHGRGLRVVAFLNLGYSAVDAPHFLRASDDVREGRDTAAARWFCWAEDENADPPGIGDGVFLLRPDFPGYDPLQYERWVYSERAGRYYWTRWPGADGVSLPQYQWASSEWMEEAKSILRHWIGTGVDGLIIDAPNWYVGFDWERSRELLSVVDRPLMLQPEGAGGFGDDPAAWVHEGGWNCIQDYGLGIWWEAGNDVIGNALAAGDPSKIEAALRAYHDRVTEAGGILYAAPSRVADGDKRRIAVASLVALGDMVVFGGDGVGYPTREDARILRLRREHGALAPLAKREEVANPHASLLTFIRRAEDGSSVFCALNFGPDELQLADARVGPYDFVTLERNS